MNTEKQARTWMHVYENMQQLLVEVLLMYSPSNFFFEKRKKKVNSHLKVINLLKFHPLTIHYVSEKKITATALSAECRMD